MKVFITVSFSDSQENIENLCSIVRTAGFEDFCFVRDIEHYEKIFNDDKELMHKAKDEIKKSDALLIDVTGKSTGRAIEAGIAYTLGKKIIVIAKKGAVIKSVVIGIADLVIEYDEVIDILPELKKFLQTQK